MSELIEIICPSCTFSRSVPVEKVPPKPVTVTCPSCKNCFPFSAHVVAPYAQLDVPAPEGLEQQSAAGEHHTTPPAPATPAPVSSQTPKQRLLESPFFAQGVPIAVWVVLYALNVPWYYGLTVLLTAQYWFGPVLVYLKQRMPLSQPLAAIPSETDLHAEHRLFLNKAIPTLEAAGFTFKGCLTNTPKGAAISGIIAVLQHHAASDVAQLIVIVKDGLVGKLIGFSRPRADGSRLATSCTNLSSPFPPNPLDSILKVGREVPIEDLWRAHQARVAADPTAIRENAISDPLLYQMNEEQKGIASKVASGQWQPAKEQDFIRPTLAGSFVMCLRLLFPWKQLERRRSEKELCRLLTESRGEVQKLKQEDTANETKDAHRDLEISAMVTELQAISSEERKSGSLALLIVTVMVFFSAQIVSTKWQDLLILVGVLFFHEAGHMAAMKLFKYTDLKMFFIPFFGAAVSGKNSDPTAVKSCVVSLMGPVPGIVVSLVLYLLFILTKNFYLFKTAKVMLLLNVFNLLPIMPLDGGRVVDVLFVNSRYFRFIFSLLGAAAFLLLAFFSKDFLLGLLGCITISVALSNLKLHGISKELKAEGVTAHSIAELIENAHALPRVIDKMKAHFPKLFSPMNYKGIFNKLTVIIDTLKFKPAAFLPKAFFLTTYAGCTLGSVIALIVVMGANYRECAKTVEVDGKKQTYAERRISGRKMSECPINLQLYYDGKGTAYADDGSVSGTYYYKEGYRTGEWLTFGASGKVTEKKTYEHGTLLQISTLENGVWKSKTLDQMPFFTRWSEGIQSMSQPFKSNHLYF